MTGPRVRARAGPARLVAVVAALLATAVSVYLTVEHYSHSTSFACPESATVNCVKVTTSSWSVVAGVPVALAGLLFWVVFSAALLVPGERTGLRRARLALGVVGTVTVLYLVGVELFAIGAICLWCTAVHVLTVVVLAAVLWDALAPRETPV